MNVRITLCLLGLVLVGSVARGEEPKHSWFDGMLTPPAVVPAVPTNFVVVSASPETKKTREFNMYDGHPTKEELRIWERFLAETKPVKDQVADP